MIVVADTGPIHYLVLIGAAEVLHPLQSRARAPDRRRGAPGDQDANGSPGLDGAAAGVV
jgi:hypothetical protein